ncbi:MAG TPA: DUF2157 domain-containing protein [Flavobacteriaceae bacterium]|nr:DUF2157 domain-containing protein [Flavobacteriaceae bacterium]
MNILKQLPELIKAEVITKETADRIQNYYENRYGSSTNRLFIVFGVLGAMLVGLGIILIIAHNWDELSRGTKTFFAFLPLLVGQVLCGYVISKKRQHVAWRESTAAFLFFSVGASIALVSQIYNIPGGMESFLLTWMLLCLPLIYLMNSSIISLLYIVGITYYASLLGYWTFPSADSYLYWPLLLGVLPHYYGLYRKNPESNFMNFHNWIIPLSIIVSLGTAANKADELMYIAYLSLFGLLYLIGNSAYFSRQKLRNNGYKILGSFGTIVLLLFLSFNEFWENIRKETVPFNELISSPEFIAALITTLFAAVVFYLQYKNKSVKDIPPMALVFILFIPTFFIGMFSFVSVMLINFYVFAIGIKTIKNGAKHDHLGILNFGLIIITALVVCRFFDTNLSFVLRGILFVCVGIGFFAANYWLLKKRKTHES